MRFHEYTTTDQKAKKFQGALDIVNRVKRFDAELQKHRGNCIQDKIYHENILWKLILEAERSWQEARRPYYSVYPAITKSLLKLDLGKITGGAINPPLEELLVRFPIGSELVINGYCITSVLMSHAKYDNGNRNLYTFTSFTLASGDKIVLPLKMSLSNDPIEASLKKCVDANKSNLPGEDVGEALAACAKLACTLCILGNDPGIIRPDVLDDDRLLFSESGDQKYVDRAQRRGKVGWVIGEDIEKCAHIRRPHLAWRHTGPGRTVPQLVSVRACKVNWTKVEEIPTGYLDDEPIPSP